MAADRRAGLAGILTRLIVLSVLVLVIGYFGYLAVELGPKTTSLSVNDFLAGEKRILQPAEMRGAPLRKGDRVYLLTTQTERLVPLGPRLGRRGTQRSPRQMLHADLWAFDVATAQPVWRKRLRTFEKDRGRIDFSALGADGDTLWILMREPIGVSLTDGRIVADPQKIEAANPAMAGKRVDEPGYVAFGGQGLQLTLSDSTQWVVQGDTLKAEPRETAPKNRPGLIPLAKEVTYSSGLQMRGITFGDRWLGVLTDEEAKTLQADPVVPGRDPNERRGAMYEFLESQHVPQPLYDVRPMPYRVWSAKVEQVSAGPKDWPKELPDNWGKRPKFSAYKALPDAPPFLKAGLLYDGSSQNPYWFREPDSLLVLHHDKVGGSGRLRVARVSGPVGKVAWDAAFPLANLQTSMPGTTVLAFTGTEPNPAYEPDDETSREEHEKLVVLDVATGTVKTFDLTAETIRLDAHQPTP